MAENPNHIERLLELAHEKSSERRRELLREVTDIFFAPKQTHSNETSENFDKILSSITSEMDVEFRKEIATRFAKADNAPSGFIRQLAQDHIEIAEPVLRHSQVLNDNDLTRIVDDQDQAYLRVISARANISEQVTGAIIANGDDRTLVKLTQNQEARFSRNSMATLVSKSETQKDLQSPLVNHKALPPDMLNEMYFFVEDKLRQRIVERNDDTPEEELERAFAQARSNICGLSGQPADFEDARQFIDAKKLRKKLTPVLLAELARNNQHTRFFLAFAEMTGLDFDTARRVWEPGKTEAVAIVCKASNLPRDLFATLIVLISQDSAADLSKIKTLGRTYDEIPKSTAERTLRFWKMRKTAQQPAAA